MIFGGVEFAIIAWCGFHEPIFFSTQIIRSRFGYMRHPACHIIKTHIHPVPCTLHVDSISGPGIQFVIVSLMRCIKWHYMDTVKNNSHSGAGSFSDPRHAQQRRLISICVPVYNEEENIIPLLKRLSTIAQQHTAKYDFEFLFSDDGSSDRSYELLREQAQNDYRIRILKLSRNFGFQRNVLINLLNARGDAAVEIDADLQDPT